jgi:hypothetical protein
MEHRFCYPNVTPLPRRSVDVALPPRFAVGSPSAGSARAPRHDPVAGMQRTRAPLADAHVAYASFAAATDSLAVL